MPDSHQEENAAVFENAEAAVVLNQADLNAENFTQTIINLLQTENQRQKLSNNIARLMKKEATTVIASFIKEII
jgi:UDP-N-acetylglucosamine:LPS N-acetylglucosamine transferase